MLRKVPLILSVIGVLSLGLAGTATAASTERAVVPLHGTQLAPFFTEACGFPIYETFDGTIVVTSHFDNNGTLQKIVITPTDGNFTLTASNPATGKSVSATSSPLPEILTFNPDGSLASDSFSGLAANFVVPGVGPILINTGRAVWDGNGNLVFDAGQVALTPGHGIVDQDAFTAFCNYLADPN
jgi:hypothetical protein